MAEIVLSYGKVGNFRTTDGRNWLRGHNLCPYCRSRMVDLGSFHQDLPNVIKGPDGSTRCLSCGYLNVSARGTAPFESRGKVSFWYPAAQSPIVCLLRVCHCQNCGWWYAIQNADLCNDGFTVVAGGVLERFDLSSARVPVEVLKSELAGHIERIGGIHPRKMEDLVASALKGVLDCEVRQLGYSKDGGIDLLLLHGEREIAVQVKRRECQQKREPVRLVREFLGASLLAGYSHLMFVTSAEGFSKGSEREARLAVAKGLVESYQLIPGRKIMDLIQATRLSESPVWKEALRRAIDQGHIPYVPDPFSYAPARRNR